MAFRRIMKMIIVAGVLLSGKLSSAALADVCTISKRKEARRCQGLDDGQLERTVYIEHPVVVCKLPGLQVRVQELLKYPDIDSDNVCGDSTWLTRARFEVLFQSDDIINLLLETEGAGAYPSTSKVFKVIDLNTGGRLDAASTYKDVPELLRYLHQLQDQEIRKSTPEDDHVAWYRDLTGSRLRLRDLESLRIKEDGVEFHFDYEFPHVMEVFEPLGIYFVTWSRLENHLMPTSGLMKVLRSLQETNLTR